jgi:hypothetical protein
MPVRITRAGNPLTAAQIPEVVDSTVEQRTTIVDGYAFHLGPNETRNFADTGVGAAHAAFVSDGIQEDTIPTGSGRS